MHPRYVQAPATASINTDVNTHQITGILRAVIPAAIIIGGRAGLDLSWLADPDVMGGLAAIGMAWWSFHLKRKPKVAAPLKLAEPKANP